MRTAVALLALTAAGCASAPPAVVVTDAAREIRVDRAPARETLEEVGPVTAQSGYGCGRCGKRGNYDDARDALKAEALKLRATYVRLTAVEEPYLGFFCFHNAYVLTGIAYRKPP